MGRLIEQTGRDLGDLIPHSFLGSWGGTVLQRKAMKCPDHAAVSPGQVNPRTSSLGYSFSALVRNCRL